MRRRPSDGMGGEGPESWIGRYRDDSGSTRSTRALARKRDALEQADKLEQAVKRGDWTDPSKGLITLSEWAELWLSGLSVTPKTRHSYEERLKSLILPRWGSVRLNQITLSDVKAWTASMTGALGRPASESRKHDAAAQHLRMLHA